MSPEFLWYIPNTVEAGHRGDDAAGGWADLDQSAELARIAEEHGWGGALLGTGWGRPDTFTVATALAARALRQRRRHTGPSQPRAPAGQHRQRAGQPGCLR
jgi:alkanesulfonate monooxygenase SsuD/methylene tetrahydromethanopterin reductase-like flavin-dependent oxidoreductase (luciferase family)